MSKPALPMPTPDLVRLYVERFDESQRVVETALSKLFQSFPHNTAFEDVLLKVVALNDLYRTNIFATYQVAEHIVHLNIDPLLLQGHTTLVDLIARVEIKGKMRNNYSFASKYCAWHRPNEYPIYDSYVDQMLWAYQKEAAFTQFRRANLWNYSRFKHIMLLFRDFYHLSEFNLKDIDKFLWLAGKETFPPAWEQTVSPPISNDVIS